ncbi:hypothetical protein BM1374165_01364 [Bartonella henselae]|uniref:Uncharacterized protein n=1 Tax=Bartonella henselae TaxID=38323 RepID=X5M5Q6_BARHN|nr:hypothetical protein BM1374165_01364 [Bartonella henselae]
MSLMLVMINCFCIICESPPVERCLNFIQKGACSLNILVTEWFLMFFSIEDI